MKRFYISAATDAERVVSAARRAALLRDPKDLLLLGAHPERAADVQIDLHADGPERRLIKLASRGETPHGQRHMIEGNVAPDGRLFHEPATATLACCAWPGPGATAR